MSRTQDLESHAISKRKSLTGHCFTRTVIKTTPKCRSQNQYRESRMADLADGAALARQFTLLREAVKEIAAKNSIYKGVLVDLDRKLSLIEPDELKTSNQALDRPEEELLGVIEVGIKLVGKISAVKPLNVYKRYKYATKLLQFNESLQSKLVILNVQGARIETETDQIAIDLDGQLPSREEVSVLVLTASGGFQDEQVKVVVEDNAVVVGKEENVVGVENAEGAVVVTLQSLESIQSPCEEPEPVGLEAPLRDLKRKLLGRDGLSRLVLTAPGGGGKTTLATKFFQDGEVKDKFKNNMFFVVVSNKPSLELIVQDLYRQKRSQPVPKNIGRKEIALQWLEKFLEEAEQNPLLLVLDDVWSAELLDQFCKFAKSNLKILVTSRYEFRSFASSYVLKTLDDEDTMKLFRTSASFGDEVSISEDVQKQMILGKESRMADLADGAALARQFTLLREAVKEIAAKNSIYKGVLVDLDRKLSLIEPRIDELKTSNQALDRPEEELLGVIEVGIKLVGKISAVKPLNVYKRYKYATKLLQFNESLQSKLVILNVQGARIETETDQIAIDLDGQLPSREEVSVLVLTASGGFQDEQVKVVVEDNAVVVGKEENVVGVENAEGAVVVTLQSLESIQSPCEEPEPVGLEAPLRDLKRKLLGQDGLSRLVLTALGGGGKTTLATKFFQDGEVKDKFKNNMFFVVVSNKPSLELIVQDLYRQKRSQPVPKNIGRKEIALQWLEKFLEEAEQNPLLLVLDDVWSAELLDQFCKFTKSNLKILVTSRYEFRSFASSYVLKTLDDEDTMKLFRTSASFGDEVSISEDVQKQILKACKGFPLIIKIFGRSICEQPIENLQKAVKALSKGSIVDFETDVLVCLQKSLDPLGEVAKDCFMDLGSFPEDKRTCAGALIDMWSVLYDLKGDIMCIANLHRLRDRSLANVEITRKETEELDGYYNEHFVTQHDVLRQLAIYQTKLEPIEWRKRLIITDTSKNLPKWLIEQSEQKPKFDGKREQKPIGKEKEEQKPRRPVKARLLSISSDGVFSSLWNNIQLPEVEVLLLNLETRNYALPEFVAKLYKLKVLIVTNYGFVPVDLSNFQILGLLSHLKRIRLECISIPSITKNPTQFHSLEKISFSRCDIGEAFSDSSIQIPDAFPRLVELNMDNCNDLTELPAKLCDLVYLKKLSITDCYNLETIPVAIGNLVDLELLRLRSCTELRKLPASIQSLKKLNFIDIADCSSIKELPEYIGEMSSLTKLNMRQCSGLDKLPSSVVDLEQLKEVVCDEEIAKLWEPYLDYFKDLHIKVVPAV